MLQKQPPEKSTFKELITAKISSFHENELKVKASDNSLMRYMNVNLSSLNGRHHPCLKNVITTSDVKKLRPYIKFLSGDYLTYERKYLESGQGNPICKICKEENESISHIIAQCPEYRQIRNKILQEFSNICILSQNCLNFESIKTDQQILTQFILDPTSFNLKTRIHISDPLVHTN